MASKPTLEPPGVELLAAYIMYRSAREAADRLHRNRKTVSKALTKMRKDGLLGKNECGLFYTGARFTIQKQRKVVKRKINTNSKDKLIAIPMNDIERQWMIDHYLDKGRKEASRVLKRTRTEVNLMAIHLGIGS